MKAMKVIPPAAAAIIWGAIVALPTGTAQQQANRTQIASQSEANEYAVAEFKRVDDELAKAFNKALAEQTSAELREALAASQRAWVNFRDADARYEALSGGGSAGTQYLNERKTYHTRLRIYQLQTSFAEGWPPLPSTSK